MDFLRTEEDNSSIVADEKLSPLKVSYSNMSCLEAIPKAKLKLKNIFITKNFFKELNP